MATTAQAGDAIRKCVGEKFACGVWPESPKREIDSRASGEILASLMHPAASLTIESQCCSRRVKYGFKAFREIGGTFIRPTDRNVAVVE